MLSLCEKFGCPPSVLDEEAADIMRLVNIVNMGAKQADETAPDLEEEFDG